MKDLFNFFVKRDQGCPLYFFYHRWPNNEEQERFLETGWSTRPTSTLTQGRNTYKGIGVGRGGESLPKADKNRDSMMCSCLVNGRSVYEMCW